MVMKKIPKYKEIENDILTKIKGWRSDNDRK